MTYSDNDLQQIEKIASIYLKISDMAVILDIPADVLRNDIADRSGNVSKAYRRGKAASKVKLHSQEMMLAQVGSPSLLRTPTEIYLIWKMMNSRIFRNFAIISYNMKYKDTIITFVILGILYMFLFILSIPRIGGIVLLCLLPFAYFIRKRNK